MSYHVYDWKKSMRILMVLESLGSGGAERQMTTLAVGLAKKRHEVYLYHYYPAFDHFRRELQVGGVTVLDGGKKHRFSLGPTLDLIKLKKSLGANVVLSFLDTPNIYSIFASFFQPSIPIIVSERLGFQDGDVSVMTWLKHVLYAFSGAITVNSQHQQERIKRYFPWLRHRLNVIYNGVDLLQFRPIDNERSSHGKPVRLLSIGSLVKKKNANLDNKVYNRYKWKNHATIG